MYLSNDIIYEEEDLPEGFSTTNSAMSKAFENVVLSD